MLILPASTTEYLHIPVTAPTGTDLSGAPVQIAVVAHTDNPSDEDWQTAEWAAGEARLLIGPDGGALELSRGTYRVWVAFDPPGAENITRRSGTLSIV